MPIHVRTWLGRLTVQVPGWYFWYAPQPDESRPWHAVPAPPGVRVAEPYRQAGRIDAATPQRLRELCQRRIGWIGRKHPRRGTLATMLAILATLVDPAGRAVDRYR